MKTIFKNTGKGNIGININNLRFDFNRLKHAIEDIEAYLSGVSLKQQSKESKWGMMVYYETVEDVGACRIDKNKG